MSKDLNLLEIKKGFPYKSLAQRWLVVIGVYFTLTILVWGLFALDRGFWQDEPQILYIIQSKSSSLAKLFTPIATSTRVFLGTPFTIAQWVGAPALTLQLMYGLAWFSLGVLAYMLARILFPSRPSLAYLAGALTLTATGDFSTNYVGALGMVISTAFYFAALVCLLTWWQGGFRKWLYVASLFLLLSVWMTDAAVPAILLTPGLLWLIDECRLTRRLVKAAVLWYSLIVPYLIVFTASLLDTSSYATGLGLVPMTLSERLVRTLLLFSYNFMPWMWALNRRQWLPAPSALVPDALRLAMTLTGTLAFLGVALGLWLRQPEASSSRRREIRRLALVGIACLLLALASNAGYASARFTEFFFRTHLVSSVWTSLAVSILAYGLGMLVPKRSYLALILPTLFVGFGIYGGVERQDYYLGYWRRHQAELRSIVEQVPGLRPDARLVLCVPQGSVYPATGASYMARAWLSYLYGDPSLARRVFRWDASCKAETEAFVCGGKTSLACGDSGQCEPEKLPYTRVVVLTYSPTQNRYILQDHIPCGLLRGVKVPPGGYNPRAQILNYPLPGYAQALLYGPEYLGALLPREPMLQYHPFVTVDSSLIGIVDLDPDFETPWPIEFHGTHQLLWLGHGEGEGLAGNLWSAEKRIVTLAFEVEPGPGRQDNQRTVELTLENEAGTQTERQQFDQATTLTFVAELQPGRNDFGIKVLEEATILKQPNGDTRPLLVLLRRVTVASIADISQAGPANYPLITVDSSLAGAVGIDPHLKTPWPIEVYEEHSLSFLWLGHGEAEGVAGTLWSDATRQVVLEFEVSPGPSREDQQRTVQLVSQSDGHVTTQKETFDGPAVLEFPVQLQPGRNDFQFTVLDEATIPVQPSGDTRPLLVLLHQVTVSSPFAISQAWPADAPLITVDSSLRDILGIDPQLQTAPWGIEVYEDGSLLWLGHGETEGLAGTLWSAERRVVQVISEVEPGPARADSQRTVDVTLQNQAGGQTARLQFDRATMLAFEVELQPGRNDFSFKVLDEATILVQPNGDTRPLLVLLRHITVKPLPGP